MVLNKGILLISCKSARSVNFSHLRITLTTPMVFYLSTAPVAQDKIGAIPYKISVKFVS